MTKSRRISQRVIYVNFAPYENAGKILDYLTKTFDRVVLFSFNFHRLSDKQPKSMLTVFDQGAIVQTRRLFQTPTSPSLAFILLPIRSFVIFLQIVLHTWNITHRDKPFDYFFSANAFTAWTGNVIRSLGFVGKTIFWVWDYYPPVHESKVVMFMRWLYWLFDKPASIRSDRVVFLNRHLSELRKNLGMLAKQSVYPIVEIGTYPPRVLPKKKIGKTVHLVYLGVLKRIQGLDLFFDAAHQIASNFPNLVLHVVGGGPDEEYFKNRARMCPLKVVFHGYVQKESDVDKIIRYCDIGIAPYVPDKSNVMYYSDPSKIKRYLNFGLPVITTDVFDFSSVIQKNQAGVLIPYSPLQFAKSIKTIVRKYALYHRNSWKIACTIQYKNIYKQIFDTV